MQDEMINRVENARAEAWVIGVKGDGNSIYELYEADSQAEAEAYVEQLIDISEWECDMGGTYHRGEGPAFEQVTIYPPEPEFILPVEMNSIERQAALELEEILAEREALKIA